MRKKIFLNALCRLRQPKARPQVHQERRQYKSSQKTPSPFLPDNFERFLDEEGNKNEEYEEGEDLETEACEEDVLAGIRVAVVCLSMSDQCGAEDLDDGCYDVGGDEDPEYQFRRDRTISWSDTIDEDGENYVDTCREEYGRGDDEEVLQHEPNHTVWVLLGGETAEGVADDLEEQADGDHDKVVGFIADEEDSVRYERAEEEYGGEEGELEEGEVAVDYYWSTEKFSALNKGEERFGRTRSCHWDLASWDRRNHLTASHPSRELTRLSPSPQRINFGFSHSRKGLE